MNTQTTAPIDTDRALALVERLDSSWREPCTVEDCAHHQFESDTTPAPNTGRSPVRRVHRRRSHANWWL